jgi:ribonuclease BN (tRNA processing enzyme)
VELGLSPEHLVFFDAGTGIHPASQKRHPREVTLCLSHFHWDHIQGLPFLSFIHESNIHLRIISGFSDAQERLKVLFDDRFHPAPSSFLQNRVEWVHLQEGQEWSLGSEFSMQVAPLNHPGISYAFQVKGDLGSFVYATDSDYDPVTEGAARLLKDADLAIMDSQFLVGDGLAKAHYGHSSFKHTIDTAAQLGVKHCVLYHFDPHYSDQDLDRMESLAQDYCRQTYGAAGPRIQMSREGSNLELALGPRSHVVSKNGFQVS